MPEPDTGGWPGVLITRPEPGASETAERLRGAGLQPVIAPFLRIQLCSASLPPGAQAILVTSGNAVAALPARLHAVPLLAVGDRTAERARAAGFTAVHSAGGDAATLSALAPKLFAPENGPLLLASGRGQGQALAAMLRLGGFVVHRRTVYQASNVTSFPEEAAAAIISGLRAALFFSAETARAFVRLLPAALVPALTRTEALTIGADAAAALQGLPFRAVRVSVRPTQDGVLALL